MEDLHRVEADGVLPAEGHQEEEDVEEDEGPAVLALHQLLENVLVAQGVLVGERRVNQVLIERSSALSILFFRSH